MTKSTIGAALLLAMAALTGGCAKQDETANVTTTNETVIDETVTSNGADDLSNADVAGNADAGANAEAPAGNAL